MVHAGFHYSSAEERQKMVKAERDYTNKRVRKIIDLKNHVCAGTYMHTYTHIHTHTHTHTSTHVLTHTHTHNTQEVRKTMVLWSSIRRVLIQSVWIGCKLRELLEFGEQNEGVCAYIYVCVCYASQEKINNKNRKCEREEKENFVYLYVCV